MNRVRLLSIVACVAFGLVATREVPTVMADDRPDIGIVQSEIPEGKGDILVVYSATWCGPCQAMRPQWTLLRGQGYRVVYIDVDEPHKYDGRYDYQTKALVDKVTKSIPKSVPTVRTWNSETEQFVGKPIVGYTSASKVKENLWKPSSSKELVPERSR